jgi:glucose-6-phosphate isomerase
MESIKMTQKDGDNIWERFQRYYTEFPSIGLGLDISRMNFTEEFIGQIKPRLAKAFAAMDELEAKFKEQMGRLKTS